MLHFRSVRRRAGVALDPTSGTEGSEAAPPGRRRRLGMVRLPILVVTLATTAALGLAQPAWAGWNQVNAPTTGTFTGQAAQFNGLACTSATSCVAVGSYAEGAGTYPMAQVLSGSTWTEVDPPSPLASTTAALNGVACNASGCLAVGSTGIGGSLFADYWNGTGWTAQYPQIPLTAISSQLDGVSCTPSACEAVGSFTTPTGTFPLAESWNGSAWTTQYTQSPPGNTDAVLNGVSCTSSSACIAVGSSYDGSTTSSLAEAWNGASWVVQTTQNPSGYLDSALQSVTCTSSTQCMAVGVGVAEQWNGTTWALTTLAKPKGSTSGVPTLNAISCLSATSCVGVGGFYYKAVLTATAEVWNGTTWKAQDVPLQFSDLSDLLGVACNGVHSCVSAGWYQNVESNATTPLADVYRLSWQDVGLPQQNGSAVSWYKSVSCGSATWCVGVGTYLDSGTGSVNGFAQYCCGIGESYLAATSLTYSQFDGVSCPAPGVCMVVGETSAGNGALPLAEDLVGGSFTEVPTPLPPGATNGLFDGVSCTSGSSCLAVGYYTDTSGGTEHALAETWNGIAWSLADPPEPSGATSSVLNGVSCTSASCTAVGSYTDASSHQQAFAAMLSGSTWTTQTPPVPAGGSAGGLSGVSCVKSGNCVAVGSYYNGSKYVALADKWNGSAWTAQKPPAPAGSAQSGLDSVSCLSATSCTAVGNSFDSSQNSSVLAEGLSGSTWSIQASPATGTSSSELVSVDCTSDTQCWGVGDNSGSVPVEVLAEQYS
jgi:hypothetical protein